MRTVTRSRSAARASTANGPCSLMAVKPVAARSCAVTLPLPLVRVPQAPAVYEAPGFDSGTVQVTLASVAGAASASPSAQAAAA